jgi:hypothetical protein
MRKKTGPQAKTQEKPQQNNPCFYSVTEIDENFAYSLLIPHQP